MSQKGAKVSTNLQESVSRDWRILVINPGSTSMKVAAWEKDRAVRESEVPMPARPGGNREGREQNVDRVALLVDELLGQWSMEGWDAVVGRGGFLPRPEGKLRAGTYVVAEVLHDHVVVNQDMINGLLEKAERYHVSNIAIPVAAKLAERLKIPAFTVDPVVVDEFTPEAEISGYEGIVRRSACHVLNVRAAGRRAAQQMGRPLEDLCLVVAHLGGGVTVAGLKGGRIVDNNIALLGGGPFSPTRVGELPMGDLIDLCYSGRWTREELMVEMTQRGGFMSILGEQRMEIVEKRIEDGDEKARLMVNAMLYQVAKEIGAMFVAVGCKAEAIVMTGGLLRSEIIRSGLRDRVGPLAPLMVFEGSLETEAMALGAIRVLSGQEKPRRYALPIP